MKEQSHTIKILENNFFYLKKEVIIEKTDDKWVALDLKKGKFYELNHTAFHLLKIIDNGISYENIYSQLCKEYKTKPNHSEIKSYLSDLISLELVIIND